MAYCIRCGYPMGVGEDYCVHCGGKRGEPQPYRPQTEGAVQWQLAPQWVPHTIAEMARWYGECGFPPYAQSRMFVGEDSQLIPSLGVFRNEALDCYETYENRRDGTRRIRVRGTEAEAVAEFLRKFAPVAERHLERRQQAASQ